MSKKRLLESVAMLVGCIIGAGILGLPYVISKAGFLTGLVDLVIIGTLFLLIHLYLGEVTLRTKGHHRLTAYAERYLGRTGKYLMFAGMVLGIYGAIVAYTIGGGEALANLTGQSVAFSSVLFFGILTIPVYSGLRMIAKSESVVVPLVLLTVIIISALSLSKINPSYLSDFNLTKIFGPVGLVIFAFIGTSAIPEMRDQLGKNSGLLKRAIIIGSIIPALVYILFTASIVGVLGTNTQEIGSLGITSIVGESLVFVGPLMAILTISTSFLALGIALKNLFIYDYHFNHNSAWILSQIVPFFIFILLKIAGMASFSMVIQLTGIITGVLTASLVILMALKSRALGNRTPEYSIFINKPIAFALITFLIVGGLMLVLGI